MEVVSASLACFANEYMGISALFLNTIVNAMSKIGCYVGLLILTQP